MAQKFMRNLAGKLVELEALVVSAGAGDAGKIVALDAAGKLDVSLFPSGIGADVVIAASSENLVAGDWVNLWDSTGIKVRKADATTNAKPALGFVLANVTSPANATVYPIGSLNNQRSGLSVGVDYWLATTAGSMTSTAPSAAGNLVQLLGRPHSATEIILSNLFYYELA